MYPKTPRYKGEFKFYRLDTSEKQRILSIIARELMGRDEVLVAVVYGGFIEYSSFRDIDVGVYTNYRIPYRKSHVYEDSLSEDLTKRTGYPVDARLLDYAPTWFCFKVFDRGVVIVEKRDCLASILKSRYLRELYDIEFKKKVIDKLV